MMNGHWAVSKRYYYDWLFSLVNQCIRRKNESGGSKQTISYIVNIEGSSNFTPSLYFIIPKREYYHEDMTVWNVKRPTDPIIILKMVSKHPPTHPVLVSVSHFESYSIFSHAGAKHACF